MTMIEDREEADSAASESGKLACDMAAWSRCDACGIAAADDVKLKDCSACHFVKYCSVTCQKDHRPQHKRACKKERLNS